MKEQTDKKIFEHFENMQCDTPELLRVQATFKKIAKLMLDTAYDLEIQHKKLKIAYNEGKPSKHIERKIFHLKAYYQALKDVLVLL